MTNASYGAESQRQGKVKGASTVRITLNSNRRKAVRRRIIAAGAVSLAAFGITRFITSDEAPRDSEAMLRASEIMEEALSAISDARAAAVLDPGIDPNRTGLIGPEDSPLTTTPGQLEAKRSTTNPNIAGLIARQLEEAGVRPGGTIAIGSSGSFPALLVASLSAAKALQVHAVCILSLGASSYGATDMDFNLLDIYSVLQRSGIVREPPAAISLGGDKDIGLDLEPEVRDALTRKITGQSIPFINEPNLPRNVETRIQVYQSHAKSGISAFINSGGGYANLGTSALALQLKPGLNTHVELPPKETRGVLFEMAAAGTPVIHLLYIKGLIEKHDLPWDPIPLPRARQSPAGLRGVVFWFVCITYFGLILCVLAPLGVCSRH
ncbi:MAG TPA: poly-gamma-glutamate system protein [Acidobacteriota bacterium]|nr:poly-gamma-glutamate system protein [Acidobacteriota bacterium]